VRGRHVGPSPSARRRRGEARPRARARGSACSSSQPRRWSTRRRRRRPISPRPNTTCQSPVRAKSGPDGDPDLHFCPHPHNATPLSPLWNKALEPQIYTVYASPTLKAGPLPQPPVPRNSVLSCHDGTIAMGAGGKTPPGNPSRRCGRLWPSGSLVPILDWICPDITGVVLVPGVLPNAELAGTPPADLV